MKLISTAPGMTASATSASCQFSDEQHASSRSAAGSPRSTARRSPSASRPVVESTSPDSRDRMPPVFMSHSVDERQAQQPLEQRAAQRQHHARVDEALPVVARHIQRRRQRDDGQERAAREVQEPQPIRRRRRARVEQHAIGDEAHEQRLDHLEPGRQDREHEDGGDGPALGPEPAADSPCRYSRRLVPRFGVRPVSCPAPRSCRRASLRGSRGGRRRSAGARSGGESWRDDSGNALRGDRLTLRHAGARAHHAGMRGALPRKLY